MKGKICFIFVSILIAVTVGYSSDISAYCYEGELQKEERVLADSSIETLQDSDSFTVSQGRHTVGEEEIQKAEDSVNWIVEEREEQRQQLTEEALNPVLAVEQAARQNQQTASEWIEAQKQASQEEEAGAQAAAQTQNEGASSTSSTASFSPSDDASVLCQIVMAEAGTTEDEIGQIMVANVILNRVRAGYGSSVYDVVFTQGQFEPVSNGSYWNLTPTSSVVDAVNRALAGEDYSNGALYFVASYADHSWFDENLTFVGEYGNHLFYK